MTLFEQLPSLRAVCGSRFDEVWPAGTRYTQGRLHVNDICVEDFADCQGTPTSIGPVVVVRVRSVIAGLVKVDTCTGDVEYAAIANRHSVARLTKFAFGDGKIELPADVRAGDVLALLTKSDSAVAGHTHRNTAVGISERYDAEFPRDGARDA